jgi:hypothetical protein
MRMPDEQEQAIIPVEQDTVPFYDRQIIAARLPDGRIAASLRNMCDALQLDRPSQMRRIRDDDILVDQLIPVRVETDGGTQTVEMLTAWAIPTWLTGIQLSRVAPEKRDAIKAYKREAADALYRHFSQRRAELAAPPNLVPAEPITKPERPSPDASPDAWATYHEQMAAWYRWQADIEQWRDSVESRLESVEEITRLVPEILDRLGPATLSPEHQRTVQAGVKRLHEVSGVAYATIHDELRQHFRVGKYEQIPEARWAEVTEWFKRRIEVAQKRRSAGSSGAEPPDQDTLF